MSTLDKIQAAKLLKCSETTLMRRARAGIVPGHKPGREWVFIESDLLEYIRQNYKRPCSIAAQAVRSGGLDSKSLDEKSGSRLALEIAMKRKSLKPKLEIVRGGKHTSASDQ
jgi:excisionase family DNA binding protein